MRTTEKIRDNALVIFPEGHLDIHAVMVFEKLVNMGMEDNPGCHLLVDLSDTAYVSSSCMRLFVEIHARLARKGLKIVLYNPNAITRKVLDLTEITRYIRVCETREQALASLELNQPL